MSQSQLAKKIGTSQPNIARLESGRCNARLSTIVDLSKALDAYVWLELAPIELAHDRASHWWTESQTPSQSSEPATLMVQNNVSVMINFCGPIGSVMSPSEATAVPIAIDVSRLLGSRTAEVPAATANTGS